MVSPLLINLSLVGRKPTGIANYATQLVPNLRVPEITLLAAATLTAEFTVSHSCYQVPANLTPEQGSAGHFRRLLWTQFQLPQIYAELRSPLIFSPVPEAPLFSGCRSVVMVHDLIPLRFPRWNSPLTQYFRYYVPQVLAQAEQIICNSTATAQDIRDFFQIPAKTVTPILLAHDATHFRQLDVRQLESGDRTAWPASHRPYFFYVGRHDPYKNLQRLINAFAALPHCQEYELWIAGSTDRRYTPLLQTQAQQRGLEEQVKFLDYLPYDQLPVVLNQAIALVYPSLWEGFGFPVLEAMACGTPVITSNLSSLPEVAGDAAILVDPYQEAEITTAMHQLATDTQARSQLRSAGLARASQFSWAKTGQATSEVLCQYL